MRVLLFLFSFAITCGCSTTAQEQIDSFSQFESASINGESAREFLTARRVMLLAGAKIAEIKVVNGKLIYIYDAETVQTPNEKGNLSLEIRPMINREGVGSTLAVPLEEPGYFLAVAHGIRHFPLSLVYHYGDTVKHAQAKVVWINKNVDLALLHAELKGIPTFRLSTEYLEGETVYGCSKASPSSGTLISYDQVDMDGNGTKSAYEISHTAPMRNGDSGCAIVNTNGELLGIHANSGFHLLKLRKTRNAYHLHHKHLQRIINMHKDETGR